MVRSGSGPAAGGFAMGCDGLRMAHGLAVPADRVLQDQSALSSPRELVLGSQSTPGADAASRARWLQGIYSPGVLVLLPGGVPTWSAAVHAHRAWDASDWCQRTTS